MKRLLITWAYIVVSADIYRDYMAARREAESRD